ncbi:hypothetical protein D3C72_1876060 [compost metagenome]
MVASTEKPRCESPSDSGTTQSTPGCACSACTLFHEMLLVAAPMRNTEYSKSCVEPVRAPTMRSVPETDDAKFSRSSVRMRSTPSSRKVDSAIENTVSASVKRRFQALRHAMEKRALMRPPPSRCSPHG